MKERIWGDFDTESKIKGLLRAVTYEDVHLAEQSQLGHREGPKDSWVLKKLRIS